MELSNELFTRQIKETFNIWLENQKIIKDRTSHNADMIRDLAKVLKLKSSIIRGVLKNMKQSYDEGENEATTIVEILNKFKSENE